MSESQELQEALRMASLNQLDKAISIFWKLYESKDFGIKLNARLGLIAYLSQVTENRKLIEITDESIKMARSVNNIDTLAYLLGRRNTFLLNELTSLTHRKRSLMLAAGVFDWIDFSLQKDQQEYEAISAERVELEKEILASETEALNLAESTEDHNLRGHVFMALGEAYFSRFLNDQLDLMTGGRVRSMIANKYFIRRWGLERFIILSSSVRRHVIALRNKSIDFFEKAIAEFAADGKESELAHAYYGLAVKFLLLNKFVKTTKYLNLTQPLAERCNEQRLISQIADLKERVRDKNRHPRNYAEEMGII